MSKFYFNLNYGGKFLSFFKLSISIAFITFFVFLGSACNEVTAPDDIIAPETPQNFTLLGGGDGQARFRWTKSTESDLQFYRLYRAINNTSNFSVHIETVQNEYQDRFLNYDSTYYYYLVAVDYAENESTPTYIIDVQPLNISAPQPPTFLIANALNNPIENRKHINLTWLPPDAGDLFYFKIYRGTSPDFAISNLSLIDSTNVGTYFDNFTQVNSRYYYKVTAVDFGFKESLPSEFSSDLILNSATLISPSNLAKFTSPFLFQWTAVDSAQAYTVFVGNSPFSDIIWESEKVKISEATYKGGPDLVSTEVYYWWVGAYSKEKILLTTGTELEPPINSYSNVSAFIGE